MSRLARRLGVEPRRRVGGRVDRLRRERPLAGRRRADGRRSPGAPRRRRPHPRAARPRPTPRRAVRAILGEARARRSARDARATHATCAVLVAARSLARSTSTSVRASSCASPSSTSSRRGCRGRSLLAVAGILVQLLLGVTTGVIAAVRRGSWIDRLLVGTSLLGISAPTFLIALLLQVTLARELRVAAARRLRDRPRRARPVPRPARAHPRHLRRRVLHAPRARRDARPPRTPTGCGRRGRRACPPGAW